MLFFTQADKGGIISARLVYTGKSEITDFSICFSLLSKCSAVSGCKLTRQVSGNGARHYRQSRNSDGRQVGVLGKRPKRRRNRYAKEKVYQLDSAVGISANLLNRGYKESMLSE